MIRTKFVTAKAIESVAPTIASTSVILDKYLSTSTRASSYLNVVS